MENLHHPTAVSSADAIATRTEGLTGIISITRPHRRNAMDDGFVSQISAALAAFEASAEIRTIIIYAATGGFCAGSDLKYIGPMSPDDIVLFETTCGDLGRQIARISKPVIAAVEDFAIGGGFTLATCCDLIVSGKSAKWSLPEVPIGWLTPWGIWSLQSRCGDVNARLLCYCLENLSADQARDLGVVDYLCESGEALATARQLADRLERSSAEVVAAAKQFFSGLILAGAEAGEARSSRIFAENLSSSEARATLMKFSRS